MADINQLLQNLDANNPAQVTALQQALQAQGYDVGKPDGKMGGKTSAAIGKFRADQDTAASRALAGRQLEQRAAERSWQNQAMELGKWGVVPLGMYAGHRKGAQIEARQLATEAAQRAGVLPNAPMGWGPVRRSLGRFAPYGLNAAAYAGEGLALREFLAPHIPNETGQEFARAGGSGLMGMALGVGGHGLNATFTPQVRGGLPAAPMGMPAPPPADLPPPSPGPEAPSQQRHATRLTNAAKAAGAGGKMTKEEAADYLTKNITDANRKAVAEALGVKSGPHIKRRLAETIKSMVSTRGVSAIGLPLAAGGLAYGMGMSDAEAAGAEPSEARMRGVTEGAAAAGGTAAGMYGAAKVLPSLSRTLAGRMVARALPPVGAAMGAYDVGSAVLGGLAQGQDVAGADAALRGGNQDFFARQNELERQLYGPLKAPTGGR